MQVWIMLLRTILNLFKEVGINEIIITPQHETAKQTDLWADVAASRGIQMVKDGLITESERALAENEYRQWISETAMSQTMYLLAVEGRRQN
ncbi:hypothetical protein [Paenibacillus xerothermodurans]|uniref:hypothetical protein n=1 Tax=Paenibacillus xerothermodurans TaxID=1977292 RepID=UPI001FB37411|nr:hypothetical protein [Paenibacillus xerothermodurans]